MQTNRFEVGQIITLADTLEDSDGFTYHAGEQARAIDVAPDGTALFDFPGRGSLAFSPSAPWLAQPRGVEVSSSSMRYTVREAATLLRIGRATLYARAKAGQIRLSKDGSRTFVNRDEITRYLAR